MDAQDYFRQLLRWQEKGYYITLECSRGQGWICAISDTGRYGDPVMTMSSDTHIRAVSALCETPQDAIADLLRVVQP